MLVFRKLDVWRRPVAPWCTTHCILIYIFSHRVSLSFIQFFLYFRNISYLLKTLFVHPSSMNLFVLFFLFFLEGGGREMFHILFIYAYQLVLIDVGIKMMILELITCRWKYSRCSQRFPWSLAKRYLKQAIAVSLCHKINFIIGSWVRWSIFLWI